MLFLCIIICREFGVRSISGARLSIGDTPGGLRSDSHYSRGSFRSRNAGRTLSRNDIVYSRWTTGMLVRASEIRRINTPLRMYQRVCSASARCESTLIAQTRRFLLRCFADTSTGSQHFPRGTTPFPGESHSSLTFVYLILCSFYAHYVTKVCYSKHLIHLKTMLHEKTKELYFVILRIRFLWSLFS